MTRQPDRVALSGRRFVCVFNRDRDSYQVPVALRKAGLLEALVTDFYAPDHTPAWLPGNLRRKRHTDLPRRAVVTDRAAFVLQYAAQVLRVPMGRVFGWVDARLGRVAGRLARRQGAHLYCYHHYLPPAVDEARCLVVFVFHPLPRAYLPLLETDALRFPEAAASIVEERVAEGTLRLPVPWSRPDAIVCASSVTARSVIAAGAPEGRVAVIPYGLPERDGGRPPTGAQWTQPRFLFVGQGVQRKGLHHLLRAWQMRGRGDASLTVVSYRIDPAIAALANDPSIRIVGYQTRDELARLFAAIDVFIMPSLLEGFGLVYLEALAHGCHIVATTNTGVPDLRLGEQAATVIEPGDLDALDAAISTLIAQKHEPGFDRQAIAQEARGWTQGHFRQAIAEHAEQTLARWQAACG